ncbi:hypothetical protein IWX49DRAFT_176700 [Phyllosticta citricarpa]|uniref:Uncharacterized protein n=2 Tax=Phyllosticta TaxID=121621 RepID=A0ABR1M4C4_9PEZI
MRPAFPRNCYSTTLSCQPIHHPSIDSRRPVGASNSGKKRLGPAARLHGLQQHINIIAIITSHHDHGAVWLEGFLQSTGVEQAPLPAYRLGWHRCPVPASQPASSFISQRRFSTPKHGYLCTYHPDVPCAIIHAWPPSPSSFFPATFSCLFPSRRGTCARTRCCCRYRMTRPSRSSPVSPCNRARHDERPPPFDCYWTDAGAPRMPPPSRQALRPARTASGWLAGWLHTGTGNQQKPGRCRTLTYQKQASKQAGRQASPPLPPAVGQSTPLLLFCCCCCCCCFCSPQRLYPVTLLCPLSAPPHAPDRCCTSARLSVCSSARLLRRF